MKIRLGFVSNSSSASFRCEFCGEIWREDRTPILTGGLCESCEQTHKICNVCGEIFTTDQCFNTEYHSLDIRDVPRLAHQEKEADDEGSMASLWSWFTCETCLGKEENDRLFQKFLERLDPNWVKKMANPSRVLTELDIKVSKILLERES